MPKVLLVEDSEIDQQLILGILGKQHEVSIAPTLQAAREALGGDRFDLVLLDVNLPDGDGFRFVSQMRQSDEWSKIPVVFLTARNESLDEVLGFSLGADDYIAKPVEAEKLRARLEARLRRIGEGTAEDLVLMRGRLKIDIPCQRASMLTDQGEVALDLTPIEFRMLAFLARREDRVFSRDQILEFVWPKKVNVVDRVVDMHLSNLRRKIAPSGCTVTAVRGVGYRFRGPEQPRGRS